MSHLITISDAIQQYTNKEGKDFTVLNNINLNIKKGEFVTLVGPSGCGKSTLLRLILGSELPYSGTVKVDGEIVKEPNRDKGIVFQKYSLFESKTVKQNIMLGLELEEFNLFSKFFAKLKKDQRIKAFEEKALEYLERVGLKNSADKYPFELSGGMRQRVAIAQAMVMEPKLLLMDEPFGALDIGTREQMQTFLLEQWEKTNQTVVFVTHDLEEAIFLGTRVIVLSQYYNGGDQGAKVVKDFEVPWNHPRSTEVKKTKEFRDLLNEIRHEGLNPEHLQSIKDFDLSHNDSI